MKSGPVTWRQRPMACCRRAGVPHRGHAANGREKRYRGHAAEGRENGSYHDACHHGEVKEHRKEPVRDDKQRDLREQTAVCHEYCWKRERTPTKRAETQDPHVQLAGSLPQRPRRTPGRSLSDPPELKARLSRLIWQDTEAGVLIWDARGRGREAHR